MSRAQGYAHVRAIGLTAEFVRRGLVTNEYPLRDTQSARKIASIVQELARIASRDDDLAGPVGDGLADLYRLYRDRSITDCRRAVSTVLRGSE